MDIPVVIKQYTGETFDEIIREIKLFTLLEKERISVLESEKQNITQVILPLLALVIKCHNKPTGRVTGSV